MKGNSTILERASSTRVEGMKERKSTILERASSTRVEGMKERKSTILERASTRVVVVVVVVVVQPDCLPTPLCACLKRNGAEVAQLAT